MLPHLTSFLLPYVFCLINRRQQETTGGDEVEALLDSGSLAGDFIAKRVVSQLKLEHHFVSSKSRTMCSGLDSKCYDISNTLALYVFYFNELLK